MSDIFDDSIPCFLGETHEIPCFDFDDSQTSRGNECRINYGYGGRRIHTCTRRLNERKKRCKTYYRSSRRRRHTDFLVIRNLCTSLPTCYSNATLHALFCRDHISNRNRDDSSRIYVVCNIYNLYDTQIINNTANWTFFMNLMFDRL